MDFIALDVETANADLASICSIGLVHFKNGEPFKTFGFLIDPEDSFESINIGIHGIYPEDVVGKPTMRDVFPLISSTLLSLVIAHHTPFDRTAINRAAMKYGFSEPQFIWLDTAKVARRAWDRFAQQGYGLANLAHEFEIDFVHHDATEDARAAGLILLRAMSETGLSLSEWITRSQLPLSPRQALKSMKGNPGGSLFGEVIVFTGTLNIVRSEAAALAAEAGCDVRNSVTNATTILVIGDQDVRHFQGNDKSSKHRKAEQLIQQGAQLKMAHPGFRGDEKRRRSREAGGCVEMTRLRPLSRSAFN